MSRHWWTWLSYGVILLIIGAGHIVWFRATHDPAIGARFGTALISLGIVVTVWPYFRTGLRETVNRQLPGQHLSGHSSIELLQRETAEHQAARPGIVHDVVAERVIGVAMILLGTIANGYGDLPLRWMGYAGE
jgi:hypothetical protein